MAIKHYVTLNEKWEEDKYTQKTASTLFQNGGFISLASGYAVPSTSSSASILGVGQEDVQASDVDYASTRAIAYQTAGPNTYFTMDVGNGTAAQSMVGSKFNLYTASTLDVSTGGTQIEIVQVISPTIVQVKVVLLG